MAPRKWAAQSVAAWRIAKGHAGGRDHGQDTRLSRQGWHPEFRVSARPHISERSAERHALRTLDRRLGRERQADLSGAKMTSCASLRHVTLGIAFVAACAAQQSTDQPPKPTPHAEDGHPDLSGRWGGSGGFFSFKDDEGTHIYLRSREAPKDQDPDGKLRRYYLQVDGDKQRAANPNKPPYKPDLLAKVRQLDRDEN